MKTQSEFLRLIPLTEGAVIDSRTLAEGLGIRHEVWIIEVVLRYKRRSEQDFGKLKFEDTPEFYCYLTIEQAMFFVSLSKNTPKAVVLKMEMVKLFSAYKKVIAESEETPVFDLFDYFNKI